MIFVIQVPYRMEDYVIERLNLIRDGFAIKEAFSPVKEKKVKLGGKWVIKQERLFTHYVFVESDDPEKVYATLKQIPFFTKLLGVKDRKEDKLFFTPLSEEEEYFLNRLMGKENRDVIGVSTIHLLKDKQIQIIDGPLFGMEGYVTKVDPHKQLVFVSLSILGRETTVSLSVNLVKEL